MIDLKGEIGELKTALVETGVDVGPVIYLARTFETDIDTVVKFFIFILIFVFDPMAVMFVISYNVALENRDDKKWPVYGEKKKEEPIDIELEPDIKDIPKIEKEDNTVSVNKSLLKKIIGQAKSKLTLGGRDESEMDSLEKKI